MIPFQEFKNRQFFQPTLATLNAILGMPACVWLREDSSKLRIVEAVGLDEDYIRNCTIDLNKASAAARAFKNRQTIFVRSIGDDSEWQHKEASLRMGHKAAIISPLYRKNKIIGILDVYQPKSFQLDLREKRQIIEKFADQIAATYRLIQSTETLLEVDKLINSRIEDITNLFTRIMNSAKDVLDCDRTSIFLVEPETYDLVLKASSAIGHRWERFKPGEGAASNVKDTGKSLFLNDVRTYPHFITKEVDRAKLKRSEIITPIHDDEEVIGILSASMNQLNGFDNFDLMLIESLAHQAGIAIRNAEAFRDVKSQATALTELNQLSRELVSIDRALETTQLLQRIADRAREVLKADVIELYHYREDQRDFVLPPISSGRRFHSTVIPKKIYEDDTVARVIDLKNSIYQEEVRDKKFFAAPYEVSRKGLAQERFVVREKIISTAAIPLRTENEKMGVMFANYRNRQNFSDEQKKLIELFASQASTALKNSRLYHNIQQQRIALEGSNKLAQELLAAAKSSDARQLLKKIAYRARAVLKADLIQLYEYDPLSKAFVKERISVGRIYVKRDLQNIDKDSRVFKLTSRKSPFYVEDVQNEELFAKKYIYSNETNPTTRFVIRERIKSLAVIPLRVGRKTRGLMFANYRQQTNFTPLLKELIELFAHQASIALKNAELLRKTLLAERYFRKVVESSPDPIISLDKHGKISIFNRACELLWKTPNNKALGQFVGNFYKSADHAREIGEKIRSSPLNRIENEEAFIKDSNNEIIPIRLSASILFDDEEQENGSIGVFKDYRELKRIAAAEKLAAIGKLAHTIGHDLKHQIGALLLYIETLSNKHTELSEKQLQTTFKKMDKVSRGAVDKLQRLLLANAPKSPQRLPISVKDLLNKINLFLNEKAEERRIKISIHDNSGGSKVLVDWEQMQVVFGNLFDNSAYAIDEAKRKSDRNKKGKIKIQSNVQDGFTLLKWSDNGIGVDDDNLPRIFEAFFTSNPETGSGLGLHQVKEIVKNHMGKISAESEVGRGTQFFLELPLNTNK